MIFVSVKHRIFLDEEEADDQADKDMEQEGYKSV
jgi:tRNA-dihydrouridine synthase